MSGPVDRDPRITPDRSRRMAAELPPAPVGLTATALARSLSRQQSAVRTPNTPGAAAESAEEIPTPFRAPSALSPLSAEDHDGTYYLQSALSSTLSFFSLILPNLDFTFGTTQSWIRFAPRLSKFSPKPLHPMRFNRGLSNARAARQGQHGWSTLQIACAACIDSF
jgi:hypothetical protein